MADISELAKLDIREAVLAILNEHADSVDDASVELCKLMDWKFDLSGNGWWDGDPVMIKALDLDDPEDEEE
jgi:hypothetical protein